MTARSVKLKHDFQAGRTTLVPLTCALCLVAAACIAGCAAEDAERAPSEFFYDFRGQPLPGEFTLHQMEDDHYLQPAVDGLHIKIGQDDKTPSWGRGIRTTFGVKGDFDITATIDILKAEYPYRSDVGVALVLQSTDGDREKTSTAMDLFVRFDQPRIRWFNRRTGDRFDMPVVGKTGRLRLSRSGALVRYEWAPGTEGDNFQPIAQAEWADDIEHVRLAAFGLFRNGGELDARIVDFRVRGILTNIAVLDLSKSMLPIVLIAGMSVSLVVVGGVWALQRRRRRRALMAGVPEPAEDVINEAVNEAEA